MISERDARQVATALLAHFNRHDPVAMRNVTEFDAWTNRDWALLTEALLGIALAAVAHHAHVHHGADPDVVIAKLPLNAALDGNLMLWGETE